MSSEDEDLKLAIALSIEEANRSEFRQRSNENTQHEPIVISSDEEDPHQTRYTKRDEITTTMFQRPEPRCDGSSASHSFLSQRAQLEAERLARQRRMQAKAGGSSFRAPAKRERDDKEDPYSSNEDGISSHPTKKLKFSVPGSSSNVANIDSSSSSSVQGVLSDPGPFFWNGELRQTANARADRDKDTRPVFRLHDILGEKSELSLAILSSYVTQISWIYSIMPQGLPVILVGQPDDTGASSVHNVLPHWVKVTPFLRYGRGCMHIKLMLLFYKSGRLRVVIPTANLVDYDWRDIENSVWLQDIPCRKESIRHDPKADDFPAQLERVLQYLHIAGGLKALQTDHPQLPFKAITDLRDKWDFSKIRVQLVPSIAGKFEGWPAVLRVGHIRLMRAIRQMGARADFKINQQQFLNNQKPGKCRKLYLECQTSSIGSYTPSWIEEFCTSASGDSPEKWLDEIKTRRNKRLDTLLQTNKWRSWEHIKILFPSLETVRKSRLGEDGAGTMFCQRRQWDAPKFPRLLFHDSNSRRGAILMHTKMILGTFENTSSQGKTAKVHSLKSSRSQDNDSSSEDNADEETEVQEVDPEYNTSLYGWLYIGSHNFTPSAWGNLSGTSFTPVMNITNYELGVVIPLQDPKTASEYVPWIRPPRKYDTKDEPWIQGKD